MLKFHDRAIGRLSIMLILAAALIVFVSACGGDDSSSSSTSSATETTGGEGASSVSSVSEVLESTTEEDPPTSSPPPAKGKSVWFISCGQAIAACAINASSAEEAAKVMGFDFHIADGKLNAGGGYAVALREAIASKPDGIIANSIDCQYITQPLIEAEAAGIPVLNLEGSTECASGSPGFTEEFEFSKVAPTFEKWGYAWGQLSAEYLAAKMEGDAKAIDSTGTKELIGKLMHEGFATTLADQCPTCEIVAEVPWGIPDLTPNGPWIQAFRKAVLSNPTANSVFIPIEPMMTALGGLQALKEAGHSDWPLVGGNGGEVAMELVKNGELTACTGCHDSEWIGWGSIDAMNRILNGEPLVPEGVGFRAVDKSNVEEYATGPAGRYQTHIPYKEIYKKIWAAAEG